MLTDGIKLTEGSDIVNAVVAAGTSFPSLPDIGELFFRSDSPALHVYDGAAWIQVGLTSSQLNGQPGSYYLALANATGTLQVSQGGTGATTATQARINLGLLIGTDIQAFDADLLAIAALTGTTGYLKKTAANTWSLDTAAYLPTTGGTITGNLNITGNIVPTANITYTLGTAALMWKDLYVGPGSIYMNGKKILEDVSDTIVFSTDVNQNLRIATSGTGNLELQAGTAGAVIMKAALQITSGKRIIDTAGVKVEFGDDIDMLSANKIINLGAPTNAGDAATKSYVDSIATAATNASALSSGTVPDGRIAASSVTQHQAALTIAESQVTDGSLLARNAGNETITGTWSFNNAITVGTPSASSHAATKSYVDSIASGVTPQLAVRAATTGNITLGGTQTVDGVALVAGNRILVKDQAAPVLNGVYVVASGSWTRASDFDGAPTNEVATGDLVFVSEGTINANTSFVLVTEGTVVVDTTPLTFSVFSRAGDLVAGNGLIRTGQVIDVVGTSGRIVASADSIDLATAGTAGTYTSVTTDAYGRVTAGTSANLSFTGDATGSGPASGAIGLTLASVGTAGTYKSITTDAKGRVTAGTNPTTLVGYGITDAQPLNTNLSALAAIATTGIEVRSGAGTYTTRTIAIAGTGLSIVNADGVGGNPTITISSATANTVSTLVARDGSGNFSAGTITANLTGNASTATKATMANALSQSDGTVFFTPGSAISTSGSRAVDLAPNTYQFGLFSEFKNSSVYGFAGNFSGLLTYANYNSVSSSTGDPSYQLLFSPAAVNSTAAPSLRIRAGIDTTWGAWNVMLHSANFSSYAPTLTGTGASGTWGISITGSAASIGGYGVSTSQAINTIPVRDSSGYTYFNYINSNTGNSENGTAAQVITTNGSDNFYRKNSLANFGSQVGPSITSLGTIATINGYSPPNNAIRMTPNLCLNSTAANAVLLNWDNGGSGSNQQVRIGNGAGVDAWYLTAAGNSVQTGQATATQFNGPLNGNASTATSATSATLATKANTVVHYPNRTDGTAYNVVWAPASDPNPPLYSCNAVTITSSTGTLSATTFVGNHAGASQIYSTVSGTAYNNRVQMRELNLGGAQGSSMAAAPSLSFHWSGIVASQICIEPSGCIAIYNNPGTGYEAFAAGSYGGGSGFTYGSIQVAGTTGGYAGTYYSGASGTVGGMFDASGNGGDYDNTTGWHFYWNRSTACLGIGGSSTAAGYKSYVNGSQYIAGDCRVASYITRGSHSTGFLVGSYNSVGANASNTNPIYTIGSSYLPTDTALSNMYGIGYTNSASGFAVGGTGWGMYVCAAGTSRIFLSGETGSINASGDITAYASDRRLKTNITPIANALNKVQQLRGVEYDWIDGVEELGFTPSAKHETGVIAQEVQAVIPDAVKTAPFNAAATEKSGVDENYLTVDKEKIIPLLIEAMKELNAKVDMLQAKLAKYES